MNVKKLVLLFVSLLLVISVAFVYLFTGKRARDQLSHEILERQLVVVSSGSSSIESFIELAGNSLVFLSTHVNLSQKDDLLTSVDIFWNNWNHLPVNGILVADNKGDVVLMKGNRSEYSEDLKINVSGRDYFNKAKSIGLGKFIISDPILPNSEQESHEYVVLLVTPIFVDDKFDGVISMSLSLSKLANLYLHPLKISTNSEIYLLNSEGIVIHSPQDELLGVNFIDYLENEDPFLGAKYIANFSKDKINQKNEGFFEIAYPTVANKRLLTRMLVAYSPVNYNETYWVLAMGTPRDEAIAFIAPFFINEIGMFTAGLLLVFCFVIIILINPRSRYGLMNNQKNKGKD